VKGSCYSVPSALYVAGIIERGETNMDKWLCTICGYVYDPEIGDPDSEIAPGTAWEDVPEDWLCPICGASKDDFEIDQ